MRCASPGSGCGSAGGSCSVSCSCEADYRWRCTSSGPGCTDVDAGPPPPPPDGGVCEITGLWSLSIEGASLFFSFGPTGLWGGSMNRATVDTSPEVGGSYTFASNRLTLREGRGMSTGCDPSAVGVYDTVFNATCTSFTLRQVSEGCPERAESLHAATFTRPAL